MPLKDLLKLCLITIIRLEKIFRRACGQGYRDMKMLLYVQIQERLKYTLMKAPSVYGACDYPKLCVAARNEE